MFDIYTETEISTIRSLAQFYESIPDYCEINHLSEKEFNSTLERLKETSLKIKNKSNASVVSNHYKKKPSKIHAQRPYDSFVNCLSSGLSSYKSGRQTATPNKPVKLTAKKTHRRINGIKKSYSLGQLSDNLHTLSLNEEQKISGSANPLKETPTSFFQKTSGRKHKVKPANHSITTSCSEEIEPTKKLPTNSISTDTIQKKKSRNKTFSVANYCSNLSFLGLSVRKSPEKKSTSSIASASPIYPAARLNLAATLRAQVSHKKTSELNNKSNSLPKRCRSKFDWEVRKTPGWKSLTYCESNKDDLLHRLETRKAEQKLQRQQFDVSMELMRQRVKSAPLLLEGITYWAPRLYNKFSHNCSSASNQSRLGLRCKSRKNSANTNIVKQMKFSHCQYDNDDLTSEDRAFL